MVADGARSKKPSLRPSGVQALTPLPLPCSSHEQCTPTKGSKYCANGSMTSSERLQITPMKTIYVGRRTNIETNESHTPGKKQKKLAELKSVREQLDNSGRPDRG